MSLGQALQIGAQVCDELALFECERPYSGHEAAGKHRQYTAQRLAGADRLLLCSALSMKVSAERNRRVAN